MAILTKLAAAKGNADAVGSTMSGLVEFIRLASVLKKCVDGTMLAMNEIANNPANNFAGLDPEIVGEGLAILTGVHNCQQVLNAHRDFIGWGR